MDRKAKNIFWGLVGVGLIYFVLTSFPNTVGSENRSMLVAFEIDEFAQYPYVVRMLKGGEIKEAIRRFIAYQHYSYGFPYYFYSAVMIFPLKLANDLSSTTQVMWVLRQFVSVLPMVAAVIIFTYLFTRFRSWWSAIGSFVFLLSVPAVMRNSLWWHPDSLAIFFVALTFYFLDRDKSQFGRDFIISAVTCGLSVGTKLVGLFFFLTIPTYILWGYFAKKIDLRKVFVLGLQFVGTMFLTIVLSNPMLLTTQGREDIFRIQAERSEDMAVGWDFAMELGPGPWMGVLTEHYASELFLVFALLILGLAVWRGSEKMFNTLVLTWVAPASIYLLFFVATKQPHFFLGLALPLFGALFGAYHADLLPAFSDLRNKDIAIYKRVLSVAAFGLVGVQFVSNVVWDVDFYLAKLDRMENSPPLIFFDAVEEQVLDVLPDDLYLVFFRDDRVYVAENPNWEVKNKWGLIDYPDIEAVDPDVILFSRQRALDYTLPNVIAQAEKGTKLYGSVELYLNALEQEFPSYQFVYEDDFGLAFVRQELYDLYLVGE